MADDTSSNPETEIQAEETPAAKSEDSSNDGANASGDTGGGTMPWGDKPGT